MAYLINGIEDLKAHLVLSATFDFKKIIPFRNQAERKIVIRQIGQDQYDALVVHNITDGTSELDRVKRLFQEAVANWALILAVPTITLQIGNTGLKTTENTDAKSADWKDKRDLIRSLTKTVLEALDDAFEIMESNPEIFEDWSASNLYTVFTGEIVRHTRTFNSFFDIQNNRSTFLALKPYMNEVEEQYLRAMLGTETLTLIKQASEDETIV